MVKLEHPRRKSVGSSSMRKFLTVSAVAIVVNVIFTLLPDGIFAEIGSLPAHPLIVHSVVVLLPLISIFIIIAAFRVKLFAKTHLYLIAALAAILAVTQMAKSSGYSLTEAVGSPKNHIEWGNNLVATAQLMLIVLITFTYLSVYRRRRFLTKAVAAILVLLAILNSGLVYLVGHSGAESVWKFKYESTKPKD